MRRIFRTLYQIDWRGGVRAVKREQLTDYEDGTVEEVQAIGVANCEACQRPVEKLADYRGVCPRCERETCVECQATCAACRRRFCAYCMVGFADKVVSVCERCLIGLEQRVARQDRQIDAKLTHDRLIALFNAELKFLELSTREGGAMADLISWIMRVRLAQRLSRLEHTLDHEDRHDPRRLR